MTYTTKGKAARMLEAVQAEPDRIFSVPEAAQIMDVNPHGVLATLRCALAGGALYRGLRDGRAVFRARPFAPGDSPRARRGLGASSWTTPVDHPRIPRVVDGWKPPRMEAPRG
jgi:hypothetical protein